MDNLTHTLVGAALGQAGLKHRTGLAMPALLIGANLPDVDIVYALFDEGLSGRRGWTHGPIGLLILPAILALGLLLFDRWQSRRGNRPPGRAEVCSWQLLLLCYVGALSHPVLDFMNSWGIRLLMPFSKQWFYGDALFIADPWIWLALAAGVWLSRRRERRQMPRWALPAIVALVGSVLFSGAMAVSGRAAERRAAHAYVEAGNGRPDDVLANPVFANPFRRAIILRTGDRYGFGEFDWLSEPSVRINPELVSSRMDDPAIARAQRQDRGVADFLAWSRYPLAAVKRASGRATVTLGDARYGNRPGSGLIGASTTISEGDGPDSGTAQD